MNTTILLRRLSFLLALLYALAIFLLAPAMALADAVPSEPPGVDASSVASDADEPGDDEAADSPHPAHHGRSRGNYRRNGNDVVSVGHNSHLGAGETADSVVSVFGSSTSEGEAVDVVSVLGNTRVTGPVHDNVVAVLGNLYVDSKVEGDAVAVLGSVQLGPHAEIVGDVTSVLGAVRRAPEAIIRGDVHDVFVGEGVDMDWLHTWIHRCLFEVRPLGFVSGIEWAWSIAFVLLALYVFLALVFPSGIRQCVNTLETQPGHSALAALLTTLLTPVLLVLLCVTVIGIAAVPFVVITLFCISLFGKAVILAWMGHRILGPRRGSSSHPAVMVLIGGAIALLLYVVPVVGFLAYKLLGFFGVGAVVYTLLLGQRARQAAKTERVNGERPYAAQAGTATDAPPPTAAPIESAVAAAASAAPAAASAPAPERTASTESAAPAESAAAAEPTATRESPPQLLAALPRAGFWLRMGALLIDVVLIGFLTQSSSFVLGSSHHESNLHLLVLAAYGACMWKLRGSTVGGIVCDLRVVRIDGRPVEWETAIVRALGCFLSLFVCGLGFIWIAFDDNHQAWHDKIAGTVVVRVPKGRPLV